MVFRVGFSPPDSDVPTGVPVGMETLGLPWKLSNIAEKVMDLRRFPVFANMFVCRWEI